MLRTATLTMIAAGFALAGFTQPVAPPAPAQFVALAAASDLFEVQSSTVMLNDPNPAILAFANDMIAAHTELTKVIQAAATADKVAHDHPALDAMQARDLAALKATTGHARVALYLRQQKAATRQELALMQAEASDGSTAHLRQAARETAAILQQHLVRLDGMTSITSGMPRSL